MSTNFKVTTLFSTLLTSIFLFNSSVAWSSWDWITETAIGQFTPEDIEILKETGREVLNSQADDTVVHWSNPETGNSGSIKVKDSQEIDGQNCRAALLKNRTESMEGHVRYLLCQQEDGTWKITVPPKEALTKSK